MEINTPYALVNAIGNEALREGELVYAFTQEDSVPYSTPGPWGRAAGPYKGYCAGLSMKWAELRLKGEDFPFDAKTRHVHMPPWEATKLQSLFGDLTTAMPEKYKMILGSRGIDVVSQSHRPGAPQEIYFRILAEKKPGVYIVSLRRGGGGHAVAFQGEPGASMKYRYFDAHFGHFVFNDADRFQTWMGDLLDRSTYRKRYTEECYFYRVEWNQGARRVSQLRTRFGG